MRTIHNVKTKSKMKHLLNILRGMTVVVVVLGASQLVLLGLGAWVDWAIHLNNDLLGVALSPSGVILCLVMIFLFRVGYSWNLWK